ncbi:Crp/Fnr family transcriptional regulator [Bradyrhizobium sp. ORS 111]|uniref:Crp/Fnr family transcriptional regulator n=1 Tax=Bradyrhizobium sp. ORS 111 TaxID=1685958 RepID=UPI00388F530B
MSKLPYRIENVGGHQPIAAETASHECCLVVKGYVSARSAGSTQSMQIPSIHVPGDVPDLGKIYDSELELEMAALGAVVVAFVPVRGLRELADYSSNIRAGLSLLLLADSYMLRNALSNVGSRNALARVAHLLCELYARLHAVGLARTEEIPCPFTQADLGEMCGLSAVHINRTVQQLRERGLVEWHSRVIRLIDRAELARLAGFSPAYLRVPGDRTSRRLHYGHSLAAAE